MRILFTGGTGKAGKDMIPWLVNQGHKVINLDLKPLNHPGVPDIIADITNSGMMFNALNSFAWFDELEAGTGVPKFDAVVHFAAVPRNYITTEEETFRINTQGTYAVLEAAVKSGIRKIIFASSETTYGICFADGVKKPLYVPIDEDHPTVPEDTYAMSKVVNEATAKSFQVRSGFDIYGLRINNVISADQYVTDFPKWLDNPDTRRRNTFSYIDARDLAHMVDCCLKTDGLGYQIFNVSNDEHSVRLKTSEIIKRYYDGLPVKRPMGESETLFTSEKAKRLVGFKPVHSWTKYVKT
jgi:nucleoside-diphosphate-sugar epimerase